MVVTSLNDVTRHLFKFGVQCSGVISVRSVTAFKPAAHGTSDDTAADAVDVTSPSPTGVDDDNDAMTTAELKQAIVAVMKRKDDVDDDNRSVH